MRLLYHLILNFMKNIFFGILLLLFPTIAVSAQIKNLETKQFKVNGTCNSAKELIEKAGNQKRISKVDFDATSQIATISFDAKKTTSSEVLKKIALAGFDNSEYFAPDQAYQKLAKDCRYPRDKKMMMNHQEMDHSAHNQTKKQDNQNQLSMVYDAYFMLKDAFVATNQAEVNKQTLFFNKSISLVEMGKLSHETHMVWMEVLKDLEAVSKQISQEKSIEKQRELFAKLTQPMYKLAKVANLNYAVYYQNCPMFNGGTNWLSKNESIKNPFYGNQMLTCGSTVETIKK